MAKDSLMEAKHLIWDQLISKLKKLKDYLVEVEDERELANVVLASVDSFQQSMGDKPLKAYRVIRYLNLRTKAQLTFAGIQDREEIIAQAKKYIIKYHMVNDLISKGNFMMRRVRDFQRIVFARFAKVLESRRYMLSKKSLLANKNDVSVINQTGSNIQGEEILKVSEKYLIIIYETKKVIVGLPPISYTFYS